MDFVLVFITISLGKIVWLKNKAEAVARIAARSAKRHWTAPSVGRHTEALRDQ